MKPGDPLKEYRKKRNLAVTPEPKGYGRPGSPHPTGLLYVVQKHAASSLHYDFRLEWNGVLLSWAIPKGPSLRPSLKRLAVRTEDHPLAYGHFEGVIPEGEYGAGTVMLWDSGTWLPDETDVQASLDRGELKIELFGIKLRGAWVLIRTARRGGEPGQPPWLLIKREDRYASTADVLTEKPLSVASHRSLAEIARVAGGNVTRAAKGDPIELRSR
jgi:bifunctional non-homologous end joining protein LigD